MDKEAETQYHLVKAVDRNVYRHYWITVLYSMFCLNCDCTCVLIISLYWGRFCLPSVGFSSLYRGYRYIELEDRYIGVLSYTFYCNFCRDIKYSSLYREYRTVISRIVISGFHCSTARWQTKI